MPAWFMLHVHLAAYCATMNDSFSLTLLNPPLGKYRLLPPGTYPANAYSNKRWCCNDMDHFDVSCPRERQALLLSIECALIYVPEVLPFSLRVVSSMTVNCVLAPLLLFPASNCHDSLQFFK
jgi:hypothetical protein